MNVSYPMTSRLIFPQTVYAVAFVIRTADGNAPWLDLFSVSGDNPLSREEVVNRAVKNLPHGSTWLSSVVGWVVQKEDGT